jgi:hypothetical protein
VDVKRTAYVSAFRPTKVQTRSREHQYDTYKFLRTTCTVTASGQAELAKSVEIELIMVASDWSLYRDKTMGAHGGFLGKGFTKYAFKVSKSSAIDYELCR